ncbi:LysE family translocator [Piscinibacter sakaiensis]|uniref:LysE family translocator n=1 Tax=Piscinibacter sakaiensis TaxID=1547922 RepID=UPI003AAD6576
MLFEINDLLLFTSAAIALNLTPGADMLFCLAQGARSGPKVGVAASIGISTGALIHTVLAALGLAALLATHPVFFEALRWGGVGYLIWLAIQAFRSRPIEVSGNQAGSYGAIRAWREGTLVNLLNPKVAVFILAFVPQFVDPARGSSVVQFLILGGILIAGGTLVNGLVGIHAGKVGRLLQRNEKAGRVFQWISGFVFIGLAARLAFERR